MSEYRVRFRNEADATAPDPRGRPMSETVISLDPGPCIKCGRTSDEGATEGVLDNVTVVDGVMRGDATCSDCLNAEGMSLPLFD